MLLALSLAWGADDPHLWLEGALAGGFGPDAQVSGLAGGVGGIGVALGKDPGRALALEVRARELVATAELRSVSGIYGDLRWRAGDGPYLLVGFAHHHETAAAEFVQHPLGAMFATLDTINHRTGFEVGGGWDLAAPYAETDLLRRLRPTFRATAVVLPGTPGPPVYVLAEIGLSVGVGHLSE